MAPPLLVMIAGPNGAGKTTFHSVFLASLSLPFLNADNLCRETGMGAYEAAGVIAEIADGMISRGESFITETVFSDPVGEKVERLAAAAVAGFDVTLLYIGLESADLSRRRVKSRMLAGGHTVPEAKIQARYIRSLDNLERAIIHLPRVKIYDNSSYAAPFRFLGAFRDGAAVERSKGYRPAWARRFLL
jgi:predicted ABC-type ATPase